MKKVVSTFLLLITITFILTGCGRLVHNLKHIEVKTNDGVATLTYDDDGLFKLNSLANNYFLQNGSENFSMFISSYTKDNEEMEKMEKEFKEDKDSKNLENININGYKGFGKVAKKNGNTELYIYLDKDKKNILCVRLNPVNEKKLKKDSKHPEKMLYKNSVVTKILNTLEYEVNNK